MSDHNLLDDPLVSFDQQPSPTKSKGNDSYDNRLLDDIDPFGSHNGQETHHDGTNGNKDNNFNQFSLTNDLFSADPNENDPSIWKRKELLFIFFFFIYLDILKEFSTNKNEESEDSSSNSQSQLNGSVADKNTLLLDFDPEAPPPLNPTNTDTPSPNDPFKQFTNLSSQQDSKTETLLDFEGSTNDNDNDKQDQESNITASHNSTFDRTSSNPDENVLSIPPSEEQEHQLLYQAFDDVDNEAQELATKIDLVSSPSPQPTSGHQPPPSFNTEQQPSTPIQSTIEEPQTPTSPKLDSTVPTASPVKKPATNMARPTSAAKPKPTATTAAAASKSMEHKPSTPTASAAAKSTEHKPAASATKSTEPKPTTTTRKTIHSTSTTSTTTASNKSKVTPTSPGAESSTAPKPTVNITKFI